MHRSCQTMSTPVCESGRKATKVGGWLRSLSYVKLDEHKIIN